MIASYLGLTVTLTLANTAYDLYALCVAVDPTCPTRCRELTIQSRAGNTAVVAIGDKNISASRQGCALEFGSGGLTGASRTYRNTASNVLLQDRWVFSTSAGQQLNVEIDT